MGWNLERNGNCLDVRIGGRFDAEAAPVLSAEMSGELDGVTEVVFDLADVVYISSAGLRVLLATYKLMDKRAGVMRVENAAGDVMDVLQMSGFAAIFGIGGSA